MPPGTASHAYLFHGPAGAGKREVARAFAAALLSDGAADPDDAAARVARGAHPDLTWVSPSGASEMLVADIDEPVVAAAARTPFESTRRVFVIESADAMGEATANRLLKTLEEPARFVHLILLTTRPGEVLPTVASRCQHVRFEPPSAERIAERLRDEGADAAAAEACGRLALGDAHRARALAFDEGPQLREAAETFTVAALAGEFDARPWGGLLDRATAAGERASEELDARHAAELELVAKSERQRFDREHAERVRRVVRRTAAGTLDLGLAVCELWCRDAAVIAEGAPELVHATDRLDALNATADGRSPRTLHRAIDLIADTRERLALNVTDELALEALAYRLAAL